MVSLLIILQDYSTAALTDKQRKFHRITGSSFSGAVGQGGVFCLKYVTKSANAGWTPQVIEYSARSALLEGKQSQQKPLWRVRGASDPLLVP